MTLTGIWVKSDLGQIVIHFDQDLTQKVKGQKMYSLFQQNRSFHIIDRIHYSLPKTNSNEFISRYITTIGHMTHTLLLVSIKNYFDLEPFKPFKKKTAKP